MPLPVRPVAAPVRAARWVAASAGQQALTASDGGRPVRILLATLLAVQAIAAAAGGFVVGGGVLVGPAPYYGYGWAVPPSIIYDSFGRCLAPMNCPDYEQLRRFLDRYARNYGGRIAADQPALAVPAQARDVPPTPAANIQPQYRGASQIRPEFEQAGKAIDLKQAIDR